MVRNDKCGGEDMAENVNKLNTILPADFQEVLIGGWLLGEGLEYIKKFDARDFPAFEPLYIALRQGKDSLQIVSEHIGYTIGDLTKIMDAYVPFFFKQALMHAEENRLAVMGATAIRSRKDLAALRDELDSILTFGNIPTAETNLYNRLEADFEYRRNEKVIKYGLPYLDELTGGLHRKELTTVAARPGVGKSSFALQVASLAHKWGEKALYFTLEMPVEQQLQRLAVQMGKMTLEDIKSYRLNPEVKEFVSQVEKESNLLFYEGVNDLNQICSAIARERPYLAVIDQLTQVRVKGERFKSRLEELQVITATLKKVALSENVCIMLLCQINRDAANSEPSVANLKGSGQIEEDSDNVILIHNLEKNDDVTPKEQKRTLLKLDKQRSGATGSYKILFIPARYRFYEEATQ